ESEVPVRTVLFVDGSLETRWGKAGSRLLDQQAFVAASIARSAITVRDPVGLVLFDESGQRRIDPGTGERHFHRLLRELQGFATQSPDIPAESALALLDSAWEI